MTRRIIAAIVGQSNEAGSGVMPDRVGAYGCPLRDPVGPNGSTKRSMWPYLAELMGNRGIWLNIYNAAVGSTSLAASWCGRIDNWVSNLVTIRGHYVLSGGGLWKCNLAVGAISASTVAPAGAADTTGADNIPWLYLGAPAANDIAGTVCGEGHSRFDPNGYIANAYAGLAASVGYDEKWMFLSIGQSDKSLGTVRADYATAIRNVAAYFLSRGIKIALGFTCYASTAGADAWYSSHLLPGYADALATYAGNSNVIAGANLRSALGVLAVSPATGPGLQADQLHMNDAAYALASEAWRDALISAGWA